jgi:hypothetical protein
MSPVTTPKPQRNGAGASRGHVVESIESLGTENDSWCPPAALQSHLGDQCERNLKQVQGEKFLIDPDPSERDLLRPSGAGPFKRQPRFVYVEQAVNMVADGSGPFKIQDVAPGDAQTEWKWYELRLGGV